jgi:hypothetical protein
MHELTASFKKALGVDEHQRSAISATARMSMIGEMMRIIDFSATRLSTIDRDLARNGEKKLQPSHWMIIMPPHHLRVCPSPKTPRSCISLKCKKTA